MHGRPKTLGTKLDVATQVANEGERMIALARRVGKRLAHELSRSADTRALPSAEEWVPLARWYSTVVVESRRWLASQPEKSDEKPLTDADYAAELDLITREKLRSMTPDERRNLLQAIEHEPVTPTTKPSHLDTAPDRWHA